MSEVQHAEAFHLDMYKCETISTGERGMRKEEFVLTVCASYVIYFRLPTSSYDMN